MLPAGWTEPVIPDCQSIDSRIYGGANARLPFKCGRLVRGNKLLLHRRLVDRFLPGSRGSRRCKREPPAHFFVASGGQRDVDDGGVVDQGDGGWAEVEGNRAGVVDRRCIPPIDTDRLWIAG